MAEPAKPPPTQPLDVKALISEALANQTAMGAVDSGPLVYFGLNPAKPRTGLGKSESSILGRSTSPNVKSLDAANAAFYGLTPQQLAEFQSRIVSSGIARDRDILWGDYDDTTFKVWQAINERSARFYAAGQSRTPSEVLDMIAAAQTGMGMEEGEQRTGDISRKTSSLDLEAVVQNAAQQRLGRKLSKKEAAKFAQIYGGVEDTYNRQANSASRAAAEGADSTIVAPADPSVAADQYLDADFAQEEAGMDSYGYLNVLRNMVGG